FAIHFVLGIERNPISEFVRYDIQEYMLTKMNDIIEDQVQRFCAWGQDGPSLVSIQQARMQLCSVAQLLFPHEALKWSQQDTVEQKDSEIAAKGGGNVTLNCSLKTSDANPYVYWYSQLVGKPPQHMVSIVGGKVVKRNPDVPKRFSFTFTKSTNTDLTISKAVISDSAMYFCALKPTLMQPRWYYYENNDGNEHDYEYYFSYFRKWNQQDTMEEPNPEMAQN
ncbi:hypothetical protein chiPu_0021421, partial [Chiloscyllium punctatum]|nr:hypothetical protein [Chiloscyllium punctatum]